MIKAVDIEMKRTSGHVETILLQNVNFVVEKGEYISLAGPAGSGKTSLLQLLGLMDNPTGGRLYLWEQDVTLFNAQQQLALRKGNIGFVFEEARLIDNMNVFENLELPLVYLNYSSAIRKQLVFEQLEFFKMSHKQKFFPYQLTFFQQQLVSLARALIIKPGLLLADEPTGRLSSSEGQVFLSWLDKIHSQDMCLIVATQSSSVAQEAQRTIGILDGHVGTEFLSMR